jgi:hypothetical protein
MIEHIGLSDRNVDPLEIEKVLNVPDRPEGHQGKNAEVVSVIQDFRDICRVTDEGTLEKSTG